MSDKFSARSPKEWDDEVLRLETQVAETTKIGIELGKELEQAKKELERWRHGKQIESDYICENVLERDALKAKVDDFDAKAQVAVAEVKVLKRKLEETEKAGEDIRRKNGELLEENKKLRDRLQFDPGGSDKIDELEEAVSQLRAREVAREADRKPGGIVRQYNKCLSSIGKVFMLNLPYMNEDDFTRDLYDSELGAIFKAVVDLYNRRVATDNALLGKRAPEKEREEAYLKAGLKNVQLDTLKGIDKVTISADGLDWEGLSHKYYELLSLARKFNMAIVVLP